MTLTFSSRGPAPVRPLARGARRALPYGRRSLGHPDLDRAFAAVHALHPFARAAFGRGWVGLEFADPVPWPLFLRLEVSRPFWPLAAALSRRIGAGRVRALTLGDGVLEATVLSSTI